MQAQKRKRVTSDLSPPKPKQRRTTAADNSASTSLITTINATLGNVLVPSSSEIEMEVMPRQEELSSISEGTSPGKQTRGDISSIKDPSIQTNEAVSSDDLSTSEESSASMQQAKGASKDHVMRCMDKD